MVCSQCKRAGKRQIADSFERDDLLIFTDPDGFKDFLFDQNFEDKSLLLMSSGDYGGLDFNELKQCFK